MKHSILTYILFLSYFLINSIGYSQASNLREACRLRVGGLHLHLIDSVELSKKRMRRLIYLNKMIGLKIKSIKQMLTENKRQQTQDKLNFDLKEQATFKKNRIKQLEKYIENNQSQINGIKNNVNIESKKLNNWLDRLQPAYRVKVFSEPYPLGYPYKIVYNKPCPAFMFSCPLNLDEKDAVKNIFDGYFFPEECKRYIQQN